MDTETSDNNVLLGRYKLGRLLGRGAFAKVYYARSLIDDAVVAIKVINKSKIKNTSMEPRIIREISAMHRLNHPNIIRIHEVMATKTKIYIVMEYAQGGELFSEIACQGQLPEYMARRYFQQLVSALHFCHSNGIIHRDIKPQNLLLDHEGNLKISDFGLSALLEQSKDGLLHTACGTPAYTAPEVIGQDSYRGAESDAWSCGVILFVLIAGYIPFDDSNIVTMYSKVIRKEFEFPSWVSKPVRSIIRKLLDPNPNTRMNIEELMEDHWFNQSNETQLKESKFDSKAIDPVMMNAFDIISMSSGMDLSALFQHEKKQERRFTSTSSPKVIAERIEVIGKKQGYNMDSTKGEVMELVKGCSKLTVELLEMVDSSLFLVKLKMVGGEGETLWHDWKAGLEEIVSSWHNDAA